MVGFASVRPVFPPTDEAAVTHYSDLSEYSYDSECIRSGTKNVGWLCSGQQFAQATPTTELLDRLWSYCKISVSQTRGIHECELCPPGNSSWQGEHRGEKLVLGSSEIRVFSAGPDVFAAPTLIYHYARYHDYRPPQVFLDAMNLGPPAGSQAYFHRLAQLGLEWNRTSSPRIWPEAIRPPSRKK